MLLSSKLRLKLLEGRWATERLAQPRALEQERQQQATLPGDVSAARGNA